MPYSTTSEPASPEAFIPLLEYQREDVESDARFRWNCWSRQTGKSFTKSLRRILRGLKRHRTQVFLSAGERQSRELMAKARQHCETLKIASDYYDNRFFKDLSVKQLEIVLPGGVRIIGLPANPQTARGFTGDVLLDEFAMHAFDHEIWAAMFPTLLRGDGELDVASTPKGRGNVFYKLCDNDRFSTSVVTLSDAISQGLNADIDEIRRAMDDETLFRQEFGCEFIDETTAFLTYEQIAACADPTLVLHESIGSLGQEPGELFIGVDVGRLRDLTVVWVLSFANYRLSIGLSKSTIDNPEIDNQLMTIAIFELAGTPFREQFALLSELLAIRGVRRCCIDAGGLGMQLAEDLVERFGGHRVDAVTFTPALKSQLACGLRIAVEGRRIRIPNDERIRNDWHSVERSLTESGHFRLSAPRKEGSHADRFWAAALAVHAAEVGNTVAESLPTP
ncbi:MAG: terminase large subunit domain-containing protein, partial [Planctomycetota bacterium]